MALAGEPLAEDLALSLQTLPQVATHRLPPDASVGDLRARAAAWRGCRDGAQEVCLTLLTADGKGEKLCDDHRELRACGAQSGSTVLVAVREADELLSGVRSVRDGLQLSRQAAQHMEKAATDASWRFTRDLLDEAVKKGWVPQARARELKRSLHAGDLTLKEVRDIVAAESPAPEGDPECPLKQVRDRYVGEISECQPKFERMGAALADLERNRRYSEMIARDNQEGLRQAIAAQR